VVAAGSARRVHRRLLLQPPPSAAELPWQPLRLAVHVEPSETHELAAAVAAWLRDDLLPHARAFWSDALDVVPAADGLGLTMEHLQVGALVHASREREALVVTI
jgi:hypothetical protein